jgi:cysteine-rich repeat protein
MGGAGGAEPSLCGDGKLDPGETCDDGNTLDGDGCPGVCFHPAVQVSAGNASTCAVLVDGRLKCWGANNSGRLGLGDTKLRGDSLNEMGDNLPPVDLGAGEIPVSVKIGYSHACAILQGGKLKCWGENEFGQLGIGSTEDKGDAMGEMGDNLPAVDLGAGQIPIAVELGAQQTCALLQGGTVKCWGHFQFLGLGGTANRGDDPGEMGDNLPAVDLGTGMTAVAISAGASHTCALLNNGTMKCWGFNVYGPLGLGDQEGRGDDPGEMGDNLPAVDLGSGATVAGIAAGSAHTCALLSDGGVKCWGFNFGGALGLGDSKDRGVKATDMGDNLPKVDLGAGKTAATIMVSGRSCALLNDGSLKCWGYNEWGQLGLGHTVSLGHAPNQMGDFLPAVDIGTGEVVSALALGGAHTCVLLLGGHVKCWGYSQNGELGYEDTNDRGDMPNEMGDNLPFVKP